MLQTNIENLIPLFSTGREIFDKGLVIQYPENSVIIKGNEQCDDIFLILKGLVKIYVPGADHKEEILGEADMFGLGPLFGSNYFIRAKALIYSEIFKLDRISFQRIVEQNPETSIIFLEKYVRRLTLISGESEPKVTANQLGIIKKFGIVEGGHVKVNKGKFKKYIYSLRSKEREYFLRILHSFAKKGMVEIDGVKLKIMDYFDFKLLFE